MSRDIKDTSEGFKRMLERLGVTQEQLKELAVDLGIPTATTGSGHAFGTDLPSGMKRPEIPSTMIGLSCAIDPNDLIAIGDSRSSTGFNEEGNMTMMISTPTRPLGGVAITREQVRQLRDFLTSKLGE